MLNSLLSCHNLIFETSYFMKRKLIIGFLVIAAFAIATISACKKQETDGCSTNAVSTSSVQGNWKHNYPKLEPDFSHPDQYNFMRFVGDSFYLAVTHRSDILRQNGCHEVLWTEYAKGNYSLASDRLYFTGIYTEENYSEKTGGCYNIGKYVDSFTIKSCNQNLVLYGLRPDLVNGADRTIILIRE